MLEARADYIGSMAARAAACTNNQYSKITLLLGQYARATADAVEVGLASEDKSGAVTRVWHVY